MIDFQANLISFAAWLRLNWVKLIRLNFTVVLKAEAKLSGLLFVPKFFCIKKQK